MNAKNVSGECVRHARGRARGAQRVLGAVRLRRQHRDRVVRQRRGVLARPTSRAAARSRPGSRASRSRGSRRRRGCRRRAARSPSRSRRSGSASAVSAGTASSDCAADSSSTAPDSVAEPTPVTVGDDEAVVDDVGRAQQGLRRATRDRPGHHDGGDGDDRDDDRARARSCGSARARDCCACTCCAFSRTASTALRSARHVRGLVARHGTSRGGLRAGDPAGPHGEAAVDDASQAGWEMPRRQPRTRAVSYWTSARRRACGYAPANSITTDRPARTCR